ncbi:hypothetical protein POM88_005702 [Heracleum sosnowskyi]|uniref:DNA-directed RNA polymerase n=1 Tax=Heracleum sosnowskyi TaxID=360622 RepID=A0AAD8N441_9APIA|nr:hypothetical protein POM88_005702 [Heracleum sosnowskyi]
MVKSKLCNLLGIGNEELCRLGEDLDDIGGYFIVNGIERVLIAQEKKRNNYVFVSKTTPDNEYIAEMQSNTTCQSKPPGVVSVHMKSVGKDPCIRATLPYVRSTIPIGIIFRALKIESEKEMMKCIDIDIDDIKMVELIRDLLLMKQED